MTRPTEAAVERHFRAMIPDSAVVSLEDLTGEIEVGCVDGRAAHRVAGAAGGSAGLIILLLTSWEEHTGRTLTDDEVDRVFGRYLDRFGSFYLHSDRDAEDRLAQALAPHGVTRDAVDAVVATPPAELRDRLLDALIEPEHVGCGHLRLILEEPGVYRARKELAEAVLRSFFRRLWDGDDRLVLEVLEGTHSERAVACVRTEAGTAPDETTVFAPCPTHGGLQFFIHHTDAVAWLRERQAEFLAAEGLIAPDAVQDLVQTQARIGDIQLAATLQRLATGLPIFDVHVHVGDDHDQLDIRVHEVKPD